MLCILLPVAAFAAIASAAPAGADYKTKVVGAGDSGNPYFEYGPYFEHRCAGNRLLVGLKAYVNMRRYSIATVQAVCGEFHPYRHRFERVAAEGPIFGDWRVPSHEIRGISGKGVCPYDDQFVGGFTASEALDGTVLRKISVACLHAMPMKPGTNGQKLKGRPIISVQFGYIDPNGAKPLRGADCRTAAVGIQGRVSREGVAAFGLICEEFEANRTANAPPVPPSLGPKPGDQFGERGPIGPPPPSPGATYGEHGPIAPSQPSPGSRYGETPQNPGSRYAEPGQSAPSQRSPGFRYGGQPPRLTPSPGDTAREDGGMGSCKPGFVPRLARPSDNVCVPPDSRARVLQENAAAESRRNPNGDWGPYTCVSGFVWREAFDGDVVCVTPERRALVKEENRMAPNRAAGLDGFGDIVTRFALLFFGQPEAVQRIV